MSGQFSPSHGSQLPYPTLTFAFLSASPHLIACPRSPRKEATTASCSSLISFTRSWDGSSLLIARPPLACALGPPQGPSAGGRSAGLGCPRAARPHSWRCAGYRGCGPPRARTLSFVSLPSRQLLSFAMTGALRFGPSCAIITASSNTSSSTQNAEPDP